jgi:hypothetical protein
VRVSVALRTGLGHAETVQEVEDEILTLERQGAYTPLDAPPPTNCNHGGMWSDDDRHGRQHCRGCGARSQGSGQ